MKQEFSIAIWRSFYDEIKQLGQYLIDSRPDYQGNPPKFTISLEKRNETEKHIENLMKMSDAYLDRCHLYPRERKWRYHRDNQTTWASSNKFEYAHLMPLETYVKITI